MACAPCAVSSPGWKTAINVPFQASRTCDINVAAPTSQATCMSWPHICPTGTVFSLASVVVTLLA
jgi:hypothetical protein